MSNDGEIRLPNDGGEPVVFKSIPPAVMQAIYHEATGKTEKLEREYKDCLVITRGDVEQLAHRITQTVQQFEITASSETVIIDHYKHDTLRYSSFERFSTYPDANPHPISELSLRWKFLLSVSIVKRYYEYQVVVTIDGIIHDPESPLFQVYSSRFAPAAVRVSVDFVDYVVARTFHAAIEEWVKTLERRKKSRFVSWCEQNKTEIWTFAPPLIAATSLFAWEGMWRLAGEWAQSPAEQLPTWLSAMAALLIVAYTLPRLSFHYLSGPLRSFESSAIIRINRGDALNADAIEKMISQGPTRAIATIASFALQIVLSIFSTYILSMLLGNPNSLGD